jgi:hypothetical protein
MRGAVGATRQDFYFTEKYLKFLKSGCASRSILRAMPDHPSRARERAICVGFCQPDRSLTVAALIFPFFSASSTEVLRARQRLKIFARLHADAKHKQI